MTSSTLKPPTSTLTSRASVWPATCAIIDAEKAAGTHSDSQQTVCDGCHEWVSSIYFVDPGSHKRFCPPCADRLGQGPRSYALFIAKIQNARAAAREQADGQTWGIHA